MTPDGSGAGDEQGSRNDPRRHEPDIDMPWDGADADDDQAKRRARIPIDTRDRSDDGDEEDPETSAGSLEPNATPIESGSPSLEHALFVLLGALAMLVTIARLLQVSLGL